MTASGDPYRPSHEDPAGRARAMQYDIALNGWELGGGSVRIHRRDLLERSFALQGHSLEAMHDKFGGMLEAFDHGAPPHGGIALGIDRWAMILGSPDQHPRGDGVPEDLLRDRPDARGAVRAGPGAVRGARPPVRGPPGEGLSTPRPTPGDGTGRDAVAPGRGATAGDAGPGTGPLLPGLAAHPRSAAMLGAVFIAFSGIIFRLSGVAPTTATFWRSAIAAVPLWMLGRVEDRRFGPRTPPRARLGRRGGALLRRRPPVLPLRRHAGGGGPRHRPAQPPGRGGRPRHLAPVRGAPDGAGAGGDPDRPRRRRAHLRRSRRRGVRREPRRRGGAGGRGGHLLRRLPDHHAGESTATSAAPPARSRTSASRRPSRWSPWACCWGRST